MQRRKSHEFHSSTCNKIDKNQHKVEIFRSHLKDFHFFFQNKCEKKRNIEKILGLLYEDFDVFERYNVDKYLTSISLVVRKMYRGRGIGEQFLNVRQMVCQEFGIKLTSTSFSSDHSNEIAKKAGFKVDKSLRWVFL